MLNTGRNAKYRTYGISEQEYVISSVSSSSLHQLNIRTRI